MQKCLETGCDKAGTHGDRRWPLALVCRWHAKPNDELIVGDVPARPQEPRKKQEWIDADDGV